MVTAVNEFNPGGVVRPFPQQSALCRYTASMLYRLLLTIFRLLPERAQETAEWLLSTKTTLGVSVVAFDDEGRVLLFQHRYKPRGSWQLPGGHAHRGEAPGDALRRELSEEGGAVVKPVELIDIHVTQRWPARTTLHYTGTLKLPPQRTTVEVTGWRLWHVDALPARIPPHHRAVIAAAAARRKG